MAVAVPYRHFRFELARRFGMPIDADDRDLARAAGERLGLGGARLAETLQDAAQASQDKPREDKPGNKGKLTASRALALVRRLEDYSVQLRTPRPVTQSSVQEKT